MWSYLFEDNIAKFKRFGLHAISKLLITNGITPFSSAKIPTTCQFRLLRTSQNHSGDYFMFSPLLDKSSSFAKRQFQGRGFEASFRNVKKDFQKVRKNSIFSYPISISVTIVIYNVVAVHGL